MQRRAARWLLVFGLTVCIVMALIPAGTLAAASNKRVVPPPRIDIDPKVEAAVQAVIHDTAERWNSQDFASVLELWDPDEPYPTYLAEEQAQWFIGWDRLRGYLDPPRPSPAVEAIREKMSDVRVKQIASDLVIAVWYMHFEMKVIGRDPIGEDVRVSAVLRNTANGWRYIHWAESPKTAMVYIGELFEKEVEPGWDDYFEGAKKRKQEVWRAKQEEQKATDD